MITNQDIRCLCNYSEISKPTQQTSAIYYLDMDSTDDEEYIRLIKTKNRDLAIDALLDNKNKEYENREKLSSDWENDISHNNTGTTSVKVKSITANAVKYENYNSIYLDIINKLDSITSVPMAVGTKTNGQNLSQFVITNNQSMTDSENIDINTRRMITRITMLSNGICINGRIGPPTSLICGFKFLEFFNFNRYNMIQSNIDIVHGNILGIDIIPTPLINENKVILIRTSTISSQTNNCGLIVMNNISDSTYFMAETSKCDRQMAWFEII